MSDSPELVLDFSRNGKAVTTTVTAKLGDDLVHVDKGDLGKSKFRSDFAASICKDRPGIKQGDVETVLKEQAAAFAAREAKEKEEPSQPKSEELLHKMPQAVCDDARAMSESADLMKRVIDDVAAIGVAGERTLIGSIYLVGVSRLLSKPLAAIVQSPTSTGKSFVIDRTASLFPPEVVIHATSLTPQALFYMPPGSLSHRFVVAGERSRLEDDETAEATRALREMISAGRLTKLVPIKEGGKMVTQQIEQPGPIAYVETTTLTKIFDEDANRCLLLAADETDKQTTSVINTLANQYAGASSVNMESIIDRHHAAQRMLQQRSVVVPFADKLAPHFPSYRVESRRAFPHFMGMVQSIALLHQLQRRIDVAGRVVANFDDYEIARHVCLGPLSRLVGGRMSDAAMRFYDRLIDWGHERFTTAQAYRHDRKSDRAVRGWLRELNEAGGVEQVEPPKGSRPATWRITDTSRRELLVGECDLPAAEALEK